MPAFCIMEPSVLAKPRCYFISPWRRLLLWWILGPACLLSLMAPALLGKEKGGFGIVLFLIFAPFLVWWHWMTTRLRLEISSTGIVRREGRGAMEASWSAIERIRVDPAREGIVLREPLTNNPTAEKLASLRGLMFYGVPYYDTEQEALV